MASAQELLKRISSQKEKRKSATIAEDIENNNVKPKVIKKKSGSRHPWDQMTPLHKAVQQKNETADEPEIQIIQKDISGLSDNKKMKKNKNLKTKTSKGQAKRSNKLANFGNLNIPSFYQKTEIELLFKKLKKSKKRLEIYEFVFQKEMKINDSKTYYEVFIPSELVSNGLCGFTTPSMLRDTFYVFEYEYKILKRETMKGLGKVYRIKASIFEEMSELIKINNQ